MKTQQRSHSPRKTTSQCQALGWASGQGPLCGCSNHRGLHGGGGIRAGLGKKGRIWRQEQKPHTVAWAVPPPPPPEWPLLLHLLALHDVSPGSAEPWVAREGFLELLG